MQKFLKTFSGKWIRYVFLKKETEKMLFAAQKQVLRTNSIKEKIDKQPVSPKHRLCRTNEETVMHLVSGCLKLTQKQYKRRHDNVSIRVNWELCKKHGLESSDSWYEAHNRPDIIVEKAVRKRTIIDIAVPADFNADRTEDWKVEKYQDLLFEVKRSHC